MAEAKQQKEAVHARMQWLWYREWCRFPSAACGARPRARPGNRPALLPPHGFELCLGDLKRRDHGVVADIVGDKVQSFLLADFVQQGDHVRFTRYVGDDRFDAAAGVPDFAGDGRNARRGASGDDDPQALFGKPARERGTKPGRRSYPHHNGRLYAHDNANLMTDTRVIAGTPWGPAMWSRQGEEASKNESHAHQHKKRRAAPFREQPFHCRTAVALDRFKRR